MKKLVRTILFLFFLSGCDAGSPGRSKSSVKSISRIPIGASLQKSQPIARSLSSSSHSAVKLPNLKAVLLLGGELDAETNLKRPTASRSMNFPVILEEPSEGLHE